VATGGSSSREPLQPRDAAQRWRRDSHRLGTPAQPASPIPTSEPGKTVLGFASCISPASSSPHSLPAPLGGAPRRATARGQRMATRTRRLSRSATPTPTSTSTPTPTATRALMWSSTRRRTPTRAQSPPPTRRGKTAPSPARGRSGSTRSAAGWRGPGGLRGRVGGAGERSCARRPTRGGFRRPGGGETSRSGLSGRAPEGVASSRVAHASAFMLPIHRGPVRVGRAERWRVEHPSARVPIQRAVAHGLAHRTRGCRSTRPRLLHDIVTHAVDERNGRELGKLGCLAAWLLGCIA
jgi:hypothetical protein